ncbi:MAG: RNA polymerase subunit sigma-70 [Porphyromonadaceae bacterium CG2_30_38_12]|nr:MAG: RNA polymerase subunit sigma-70 [Porphyromonadaceae bacterium CG2_30_38_12]
MLKEEENLLQQLKNGEEKAYRLLFKKHYGLLCSIASEFLKDDYLAETIVGDVILYIWENRQTIEIQTSIRSYLIRAVRNKCINYLQLNHVKKETSLPENEILAPSENSYFISDSFPLAILLEKELEQKIEDAIQHLPLESREVFELSRFENLSYDEIAQKLGISVNTVKYHIKNALSKLRNDLGNYLSIWVLWLWLFK